MKTFTPKPLAWARQQLDFSLEDLASRLYAEHRLSVSSVTLRSWELGETTPDADILPKLLTVLKLKLDDVYPNS